MKRAGIKVNKAEDLDKQILNESKRKDHERKQKIFDALTSVASIAIYVIPLVLGMFYIFVLIHKMRTGEWSDLEITLKAMLLPVASYFAGVMSKSGIIPR